MLIFTQSGRVHPRRLMLGLVVALCGSVVAACGGSSSGQSQTSGRTSGAQRSSASSGDSKTIQDDSGFRMKMTLAAVDAQAGTADDSGYHTIALQLSYTVLAGGPIYGGVVDDLHVVGSDGQKYTASYEQEIKDQPLLNRDAELDVNQSASGWLPINMPSTVSPKTLVFDEEDGSPITSWPLPATSSGPSKAATA